MAEITTVEGYLEAILENLRNPTQELEFEPGVTTNVRIDPSILSYSSIATSFNQYGQTIWNFTTYIMPDVPEEDIPDFDDDDRYQPDPGNPDHTPPIPRSGKDLDWEGYDSHRCLIATYLVEEWERILHKIVDLALAGYQFGVEASRWLADAVLVIAIAGAFTAGTSLLVGFAAWALIEIASRLINLISTAIAQAVKDGFSDRKDALICAIYNNKSPKSIKNAWDAVWDDLPLVLAPLGAIFKILMNNRVLHNIAEGNLEPPARAEAPTCAGCGAPPSYEAEYVFSSEVRSEIIGPGHDNNSHYIWPDQNGGEHIPPFVISSTGPEYFLYQGFEKRYAVWSYLDREIVFCWREVPGGELYARFHPKSQHYYQAGTHDFPENVYEYFFKRPIYHYNFAFNAKIFTE